MCACGYVQLHVIIYVCVCVCLRVCLCAGRVEKTHVMSMDLVLAPPSTKCNQTAAVAASSAAEETAIAKTAADPATATAPPATKPAAATVLATGVAPAS